MVVRKIKDIEIQEMVQLLFIKNLGVAMRMPEERQMKNSLVGKMSRNYRE